jgi:hypothetical protein
LDPKISWALLNTNPSLEKIRKNFPDFSEIKNNFRNEEFPPLAQVGPKNQFEPSSTQNQSGFFFFKIP